MVKTLEWDFFQLLNRHKDGSYTTQQDRKRILRRAARDLDKLGFKQLRARSLKPKHIWALRNEWGKHITTNTYKIRCRYCGG